jgi:IS30 family transposase
VPVAESVAGDCEGHDRERTVRLQCGSDQRVEQAGGGEANGEQVVAKRNANRRPKQDRRGQLPRVVTISGRPETANQRSRLGDWEGGTIVSPGKRSGLLTVTDRSSGYLNA